MLYRFGLKIILGLMAMFLVACQTLKPTVQLSPEATLAQGKQDFNLGDYAHAYAELQPLAQQGNAEAQYALGYMQYYGLGIPQNKEEARNWTQKAALQGHPAAQHAMAEFNKQLIPIQPIAKTQNPPPATPPAPQIASNHYVLQLMASHDEAALQQWLLTNSLPGAHLVQSTRQGEPWYLLIMGDYASRPLAEQAAQEVQQKQPSLQPWIRLAANVSVTPTA